MTAQPNLNPKNMQAQLVYIRETYSLIYVVEMKETNLRSGKVLRNAHSVYIIEYIEKEMEYLTHEPNNPPYPKRLIHFKTQTLEEAELLAQIKNVSIFPSCKPPRMFLYKIYSSKRNVL